MKIVLEILNVVRVFGQAGWLKLLRKTKVLKFKLFSFSKPFIKSIVSGISKAFTPLSNKLGKGKQVLLPLSIGLLVVLVPVIVFLSVKARRVEAGLMITGIIGYVIPLTIVVHLLPIKR